MKKILTISAAIAIISISNLTARDFRVNQLPNGSKFRCSNCHVSSGGGGSLNKFGQVVGSKYLNGGNVVWNAELAGLDSDGDGFTNGAELGDPKGEWKIGQANPNVNEVTNPGNAQSIPSDVLENSDNSIAGFVQINSIFPNPLNSNTELRYEIAKSATYNIGIYNSNGILVDELFSGELNPGSYINQLQNIDNFDSGIYFLVISNGKSNATKKLIKLK